MTVRENGDSTRVENQIKDWTHTNVVKLFVRLIIVKSVVELKLLVFDVLCYAVDLEFVLVNDYARVAE